MASIIRNFKLRISLFFAIVLQCLQAVHGYGWWTIFSSLGLWSLAVPVTTTYGGVAMVLLDEARGVHYTSEWARVATAAFLAFFYTLTAIGIGTLAILVLGCFGIFFR